MKQENGLSRRSFLKKSTAAGAGASAFTIIKPDWCAGLEVRS